MGSEQSKSGNTPSDNNLKDNKNIKLYKLYISYFTIQSTSLSKRTCTDPHTSMPTPTPIPLTIGTLAIFPVK